MKLMKTSDLATDVVTHDVSPLTVHTDARAYSRLGWLIVLVGVLGFMAWAIFAPLDKGVPLSGTVARESNRKAIQYMNTATVEEILVHDGDTVKAGQVLVRMNGVLAKSQQGISRIQYYGARAMEARLVAERDGKAAVAFPPQLAALKSDPVVASVVALQEQLFLSRRSSLQNELASVDESVAGIEIQAKGLEQSRDSKREQLKILDEQLANMRDLAKDGYVARSRLLDLERTAMQINGSVAEDIGNIGRARRQVAELKLKRSQRLADFQKEARTQLADAQKEAGALASRLEAEDYNVDNIDVKSPVDGVVVGMAVFTRGGVVSPGFKMMEVVPSNDALIVEGQLPINLVDKVHAGLPTELIFSAFNSNSTPHIPGEVLTVSADRLLDEHTGAPYYKVQVRVTPKGVKLLAEKKLDVRPGMPVELFVKTGERTMMSYLLKPVFDRAKTSMTEE